MNDRAAIDDRAAPGGGVRYRARPFGFDIDPGGEEAWVGIFPSGPYIHVNATALLMLLTLEEAGEALTADEVADRMRRDMPDMPAHAAEQLRTVLEEFAADGLVDTA